VREHDNRNWFFSVTENKRLQQIFRATNLKIEMEKIEKKCSLLNFYWLLLADIASERHNTVKNLWWCGRQCHQSAHTDRTYYWSTYMESVLESLKILSRYLDIIRESTMMTQTRNPLESLMRKNTSSHHWRHP
jgi:hypothetical protein